MDNWQKLNAYVDGELDADETAGIAKSAADNPDVARDIAALSQLKATLSRCDESFDGELPTVGRSLFARRQPWLVAAGTAFLTFIVLMMLGTDPHSKRESFEDFALAEHQRWTTSLETVAINADNKSDLVPTAESPPAAQTPIPDISNIGLKMINLSEVRHADRSGWHVGYLGRNGCKASLFILTDGNPQSGESTRDLTRVESEKSALYFWTTSGRRYYLTATDMSEQRLAIVSKLLHLKTSGENAPGRITEMIALQDQYSAAASCMT